jgi:uncharacterized protein YjbI with pentapeptide repeats
MTISIKIRKRHTKIQQVNMTAEKTVEKIKEDVQNLVAPKPANVPAQTKPHYWLYKQGREVWNRWSREAFFDENGKDDGRIDGYIEDAKAKLTEIEESGKSNLLGSQKSRIQNLEEFKALSPLSDFEKAEIENKMQADYSDWSDSNKRNIQFLKAYPIKLPEIKDTIDNRIDFSNTDWNESVNFSGFVFPYNVDFSSATFSFDADFSLVTFSSFADFSLACFCYVNFSSSYFCYANFGLVVFNSANFFSATFSREGNFSLATFSNFAHFGLATFSSSAKFLSATFSGSINFSLSTFFFDAYFSLATFSSSADFERASFKSISLRKTVFEDDAVFRNAKFESVPKVSGMKIEGVLDLNYAQWPDVAKSEDPDTDALNYSQIKRRMQELHLHDHEIFFFRKELLCRAEASKRKSEALRKPREIALEFDKSNWRHDVDENMWKARIIYLYDAVCKCGDSVARPSLILFNVFYVMIFIYPLIAGKMSFEHIKVGLSGEALLNGLYLSTTHTWLFLLPNKSTYDRVFTNLYGEQQSFEFLYSLLSGFQTFISMALIFLIGLCLRNYLRIK